ncbi:MAG TPA: hypothetical protein GXZ23_03135 [Clostridiales bacterium]|jgi:hypothetical protein|nr:hypothetical protein [Clostridiales bacterium]
MEGFLEKLGLENIDLENLTVQDLVDILLAVITFLVHGFIKLIGGEVPTE